jgi:hypothetical protein
MSYAEEMRNLKLTNALDRIADQMKLANEIKLCTELYKCGCMTENDYKSRMQAIRDLL